LLISKATELESLYELMPLAGLTLSQPTTMKLLCSNAAQDATLIPTDDVYYLKGTEALTDASGNVFFLRTETFTKSAFYGFEKSFLITDSGQKLTLSIAKEGGQVYFPLSYFNNEEVEIEFPYYRKDFQQTRIATVTFNHSGLISKTVSTGSTTDIGACTLDQDTGLLLLVLSTNNTFDNSALDDLHVKVSFISRSVHRKDILPTAAVPTNPTATYPAYANDNIRANAATGLTFNGAANTSFTALLGYKIGLSGTLQHSVDTTDFYDLSQATALTDDDWGQIYKVESTVNSTKYYLYILDIEIGLIICDDIYAQEQSVAVDQSLYSFDLVPKLYASRMLVEQYAVNSDAVNPATSFDFSSMTYELEADDPILFNDISIQITDAGYTTVFTETDNLNNVQPTITQTYFEVQPISPTKVRITFDSVLGYATINTVLITYKTVKQLDNYQSGEVISGPSTIALFSNAVTLGPFNYDGTNLVGNTGASGIPSLEDLRSTLTKAAYTLDKNITRNDYEGAIQNYFIGAGFGSTIKVFDYEDFGTIFVNVINGNVVFYVGLINRYIDQNLVLTVNSDMTSSTANTPQLTRQELAAQLPGIAITDADLGILTVVPNSDADTIAKTLKDDSVMTNYLLTQNSFIRFYAIYFKLKIKPKDQYTFAEADSAVKTYLASLFKWESIRFVRDINVSDVYHDLDALDEIDKVFLTNMSHYHNDDSRIKVHDITYLTVPAEVSTGTIRMKQRNSNTLYLPNNFTRYLTYTVSAAGSTITLSGAGTYSWDLTGGTGFGFQAGDKINMRGFTNSANNVTDATIASITGSGKILTLSGVSLVNEAITDTDGAPITVSVNGWSFDTDFGITVNRILDVTLNAVENTALSLTDVSSFLLTFEDDSLAGMIHDTWANGSIDTDNEQLEHPLWNFTNANTTRQIVVDVLGLGGVLTESY